MHIFANDISDRDAPPARAPNLLLERLGPTTEAALRNAGRNVAYAAGEQILDEDAAVTHVLFVERGLVTVRWADLDGALADVDLIAQDGAVALLEALARAPVAFDIRAELATEGLLVPADTVRQVAEANPSVAAAFWRHALDQQTRARRGVGCASGHGARARLADYLLAIDALSPADRMPLTQEGLAAALGVYRTTVTALVAALVEERVVVTGRGWLRVLDRAGLSQVACGCRGRA